MKHLQLLLIPAISILICAGPSSQAAPVRIDVDGANPTVELSPHLYGLFFEDINFAADGGLYAELIQNRSFEYYAVRGNDRRGRTYHPLYAWSKIERGGSAEMTVEDASPLNERNTHYLKLNISQAGQAVGVANDGFDGIRLDAGKHYDVSLYARQVDWSGNPTIRVALELEDGTPCAEVDLEGAGSDWSKLAGVLTSSKTTDKARLVVTTAGQGTLCLDMVSVFPQDTFNDRENGMRDDLAQALKDLNPKFLRFPGGCIAHGDGLDNVYRWKDTVGDVAERKPNWNRWGYHQTYGLGYFEYFVLCEDLGATAIPVVPVGVSCGFTPPQEAVPIDEIGPWVQDALDLIEFANGPVTSNWGGLRARMGHPEPFNLRFVALGNEPHDNALFRDRFPIFVKALREAHPEIEIIGTSGLGWQIPIYDLMTEHNVYSSDEHYYEDPDWFLANQDRFDDFDRNKPLIFVGEYASRGNTMFNAVAEAAYLTGVERNGDIVDMTCYAPLLANVEHTQWHPDLIHFDKRTVVKTPNYYVQQLFAQNKGDVYLPSAITLPPQKPQPTLAGGVGIGTWATAIEVDEVSVNGQKLDPSGWTVEEGDFQTRDGRYVQLDTRRQPAISLSADRFDGDEITYKVRARKTDGREGFLVVFGAQDDPNSYWWNIGGWGNTQHGIQGPDHGGRSILVATRGSIEADRWYDIEVKLSPGKIVCSLDGEVIHDYEFPHPSISVATALDKTNDEVILKLVNPSDKAVDTRIRLKGVGSVQREGTLMVIAGEAAAQNSVEAPDNIRTETRSIRVGKRFRHTLPPTSVQFIRVKKR